MTTQDDTNSRLHGRVSKVEATVAGFSVRLEGIGERQERDSAERERNFRTLLSKIDGVKGDVSVAQKQPIGLWLTAIGLAFTVAGSSARSNRISIRLFSCAGSVGIMMDVLGLLVVKPTI